MPVGIAEDPVTGSLNASLAQWLIEEKHMPERYVAAQGACLSRAGRVHIERDAAGQVWVGGAIGDVHRRQRDAMKKPAAQVDHLVIAAQSLDQGVQWCEATLGVTPRAGGEHPLMGTHNRLLRLSTPGYPRAYLEIIAIDPACEAAGPHPLVRPRRPTSCSEPSTCSRGWCTSWHARPMPRRHSRHCIAWASTAGPW